MFERTAETPQREAPTSAQAAKPAHSLRDREPDRGRRPSDRSVGALGPLRGRMESLFGQDFSTVRLHQDTVADRLGARAATIGDDIHLAADERDVLSPRGESLVAHELAHVVQQRRPSTSADRSTFGLEMEAESAALTIRAGGRPRVNSRPSSTAPLAQLTPRAVPPPPAGNVLYIGMNNADPEIRALTTRYGARSPIKVTAIKATEEETATSIGGSTTYDLTTTAGVDALVKALTSDTTKQAALATLLNASDAWDRDDLAHAAKVYAATEADGQDRMTRVVLSGHNYGRGVYGPKGHLYFDALVKLAEVFPKAANQTKHLIVAGCMSGAESDILNIYVKAFPSLVTVWAWWGMCPTGAGAAAAIATWASLTEHGEKTLPAQGGGIATWSGGTYVGDPGGAAPPAQVISSIHANDAVFNEYVTGIRADPSPHGGWLESYYQRVFNASRRADITGPDHDVMESNRHRSFVLRYWKNVAKHFWVANGAVITKGYGTAPVPDYANLSRSDTVKAITAFGSISTATGPDKAAAAALLNNLMDLDPATVKDDMTSD